MTLLNKLLIGLVILAVIVGCISNGKKAPQNNTEYASTSVMVTLESKISGGSGVIYRSTPTSSWVLTNKHVCQLIQGGGLVSNDQGDYPVYSYRVYKQHDLCLIRVMTDLHVNTKLAEHPPELYSPTIIAGHPALLPTMVTKGHFTHKMNISLIVGTTPCTGDEDGEELIMCALFGQKPVITTLTAQPTTATIMAGSSGSGVFNAKGEIAGLVFAGREGLSYGFLVPYEYINHFLSHLKNYPEEYPKKDAARKNFFADIQKIQNYCRTENHCKGIMDSGIYYGN